MWMRPLALAFLLLCACIPPEQPRAWLSATIDPSEPATLGDWSGEPITWVVADDAAPTLLYVDARDSRAGVAFAELLLVRADDP